MTRSQEEKNLLVGGLASGAEHYFLGYRIDGTTTVRLMKHEAATIKSSSQSIRHGCHTFTVASVGFSNG